MQPRPEDRQQLLLAAERGLRARQRGAVLRELRLDRGLARLHERDLAGQRADQPREAAEAVLQVLLAGLLLAELRS